MKVPELEPNVQNPSFGSADLCFPVTRSKAPQVFSIFLIHKVDN